MVEWLDTRICDRELNAENTQTYREWIHDINIYIYGKDCVSDEWLNGLSEQELEDVIDELDWLAEK